MDIRTQWYNPIVIEKAPKFRKALVAEYNETAKKYSNMTDIKLEQKS